MDLYEYQGKQLFARFGIPVSEGRLATDAGRGAGGRGGDRRPGRRQGAGADRRARQGRRDQARREPRRRGREGRGRSSGWTSAATSCAGSGSRRASDIEREYYLSLTFDRGAKQPLFMFTTEGGVEIEEVAANEPRRARPAARRPARGLPAVAGAAADLRRRRRPTRPSRSRSPRSSGSSTQTFVGTDAMLCEINPLIVTPDGEVRALDSKFTVDDNAFYRHPDWRRCATPRRFPPRSARPARRA